MDIIVLLLLTQYFAKGGDGEIVVRFAEAVGHLFEIDPVFKRAIVALGVS